MKLSEVIKIWDIIHVRDTGELGYCDLEKAIETVTGIENDIPGCSDRTYLQSDPTSDSI